MTPRRLAGVLLVVAVALAATLLAWWLFRTRVNVATVRVVPQGARADAPPRLPVYVISGSASRRRALEPKLAALGDALGPVTWVAAVTPDDLPPVGDDGRLHEEEFPTARACMMSHVKAATLAAAAGHPVALVLEDDARFHKDAGARLTTLAHWLATAGAGAGAGIAEAGGGVQFLSVGYLPSRKGALTPSAVRVPLPADSDTMHVAWPLPERPWGCQGYLLTADGAATIARVLGGQPTWNDARRAAEAVGADAWPMVADTTLFSVCRRGIVVPPPVVEARGDSLIANDHVHGIEYDAAAMRGTLVLSDYDW